MNKLIKSRLFAFVLGAVIFSGITGVAAISILAKDIKYTPSDNSWKKANGDNITNVEEAIDELYNTKIGQRHVVNEQAFSLSNSTPKTFDIKLLTNNYSKLTTDNFFYSANFYVSGNGLESRIDINYDYNSDTGILTVSSNGLSKPGYYFAYFQNVKFYYFD